MPFYGLIIKFLSKVNNKITEQASLYNHLEKMTTDELVKNMNKEDAKVAFAVKNSSVQICQLIDAAYEKMKSGGRLIYLGAGTSGRLGVLDASECPPTFGIPDGLVIGIIAGGDKALRSPVEFAEDSKDQAWKDLCKYSVNDKDFVIGIAASGSTPYVAYGLNQCRDQGISTGSIVCNPNSWIEQYSDFPVTVIVGPEFLTGSTRLKSGTAQKMVLNTISTSVMIKLGRVRGNKMVDMMLSNDKLFHRGVSMIVEIYKIPEREAKLLLASKGSVREVCDYLSSLELKR